MEVHLRTKDIKMITVKESYYLDDFYYKPFKKGGLFCSNQKEGFYHKYKGNEYFDNIKDYFMDNNNYYVVDDLIKRKAYIQISLFKDSIETITFDTDKEAFDYGKKIAYLLTEHEFISIDCGKQ